MGIVCHFVIASVNPGRGGAQQRGRRLAESLAAQNDVDVVIYGLNQDASDAAPKGCHLRPLLEARARLMAPLAGTSRGALAIDLLSESGFQTTHIVLRESLRREIEMRPADSHVIVSFSLTRLAPLAQRIGFEFDVPHVVSIPGSDFARDFATPAYHAAVEFVIRQAEWVLPSNQYQADAIARIFGRTDRVTISSAALPAGSPTATWEPHGRDEIHIVSDTGFSLKKATHLLLEAVWRLRQRGRMMRLSIVGSTAEPEAESWERTCADYTERLGNHVWLNGHIPKQEVEPFLLDGDIYASASLSEGSSNAVSYALALGIPIVAGRTGSLPDIVLADRDAVEMYPPGDLDGLIGALDCMADRVRAGTVTPDSGRLAELRDHFSPEAETRRWLSAIEAVTAGGERP